MSLTQPAYRTWDTPYGAPRPSPNAFHNQISHSINEKIAINAPHLSSPESAS